MEFTEPQLNSKAFNCPHCGAYAQQTWSPYIFQKEGSNMLVHNYWSCQCLKCGGYSFWKGAAIKYPLTSLAPLAPKDMPEDIAQDYNEAREVLAISPRSSAALLRLVVQKLCKLFGLPGKDINQDIAALVKRGLSPSIQQALDSVRVIGNNALHPGEMDVQDDQERALLLFKAVNFIVQHTITEQKEMEALYGSLPENYRRWIDERDHRA